MREIITNNEKKTFRKSFGTFVFFLFKLFKSKNTNINGKEEVREYIIYWIRYLGNLSRSLKRENKFSKNEIGEECQLTNKWIMSFFLSIYYIWYIILHVYYMLVNTTDYYIISI